MLFSDKGCWYYKPTHWGATVAEKGLPTDGEVVVSCLLVLTFSYFYNAEGLPVFCARYDIFFKIFVNAELFHILHSCYFFFFWRRIRIMFIVVICFCNFSEHADYFSYHFYCNQTQVMMRAAYKHSKIREIKSLFPTTTP